MILNISVSLLKWINFWDLNFLLCSCLGLRGLKHWLLKSLIYTYTCIRIIFYAILYSNEICTQIAFIWQDSALVIFRAWPKFRAKRPRLENEKKVLESLFQGKRLWYSTSFPNERRNLFISVLASFFFLFWLFLVIIAHFCLLYFKPSFLVSLKIQTWQQFNSS